VDFKTTFKISWKIRTENADGLAALQQASTAPINPPPIVMDLDRSFSNLKQQCSNRI
jgi:hypothetical protein